MIFYKWTHIGAVPGGMDGCYLLDPVPADCYEPSCAPTLLIGLINMFMMKTRNTGMYRFPDKSGPGGYQTAADCADNAFYSGQVSDALRLAQRIINFGF